MPSRLSDQNNNFIPSSSESDTDSESRAPEGALGREAAAFEPPDEPPPLFRHSANARATLQRQQGWPSLGSMPSNERMPGISLLPNPDPLNAASRRRQAITESQQCALTSIGLIDKSIDILACAFPQAEDAIQRHEQEQERQKNDHLIILLNEKKEIIKSDSARLTARLMLTVYDLLPEDFEMRGQIHADIFNLLRRTEPGTT